MWCLIGTKGGAGCSVISAALGLLSARERPTLLVDLGGDLPAILGAEEAQEGAVGLGVADWLVADHPPPDALARLEIAVGPCLSVLPRGRPSPSSSAIADPAAGKHAESIDLLARVLAAEDRRVIVDVGMAAQLFTPVLDRSSVSILVTRACYLALCAPRSHRSAERVVLIQEPGRSLRASDVGAALGAPVAITVQWEPSVARAVDAGLLVARLPRPLLGLRSLLADLSRTSVEVAVPGR